MRRAVVLLALGFGALLGANAASAAELSSAGPSARTAALRAPRGVLPFPRSERAQAVWAAGACWSGCQSYCTWGLAGCLEVEPQGRCLTLTDRCDRYCQRECRTQGGPLLGFID